MPANGIGRRVVASSGSHACCVVVKPIGVFGSPSMSHGPFPKLIRREIVPVVLQVLEGVDHRRMVAVVLEAPLPFTLSVNTSSHAFPKRWIDPPSEVSHRRLHHGVQARGGDRLVNSAEPHMPKGSPGEAVHSCAVPHSREGVTLTPLQSLSAEVKGTAPRAVRYSRNMAYDRLKGRVYLAWDDGYGVGSSEDELHPHFYGHLEDGGSLIEHGPEFADASDAVRWWRERGADNIVIRLDHHRGYFWAGVGPPPVKSSTGQPMPVFSHDDPAGRPESSQARAEAAQREMREQVAAHEANKPFVMGERLRERREAIGLSVEGLAERMGVSDTWVEDVESGRTASTVTINQWVDLVWATKEPWPDERRLRNIGRYGWAAGDLLYGAEDIVQHHLDVVERQDSPEQET